MERRVPSNQTFLKVHTHVGRDVCIFCKNQIMLYSVFAICFYRLIIQHGCQWFLKRGRILCQLYLRKMKLI